jgi:4-aminobutyrate aminotransferase-like enzyme
MKNILWSIVHDLTLKNITHAGGYFIYDADGNSYLDMESGAGPEHGCHSV